MIPRSLIVAAALTLALADPAHALEQTYPARGDTKIRYVPYDPHNVVPLRTTMGTALMITFGAEEHIVKVAVSDSSRLLTDVVKVGSDQLANYLFLKAAPLKEDPAGYVLPPQPLMVVTERAGALRHYQFRLETQAEGPDPDYAVFFTYADDERAARRAEAQERAGKAEVAQTKAILASETNLVSQPGTPSDNRNYRYSARGDYSLAPTWVWDNGFATYFFWPAMQRLPAIFRGACGAGEATSDSSTHEDVVIVPGTAQTWCLRDQRSAIEIYNLGYTTVGATTGTKTISPRVRRVIRHGR